MSKVVPPKFLVDTNVAVTANLSVNAKDIPPELVGCVSACVALIGSIMETTGLVLDSDNEIYEEYRKNLGLAGRPGIGHAFLKWVHDTRWKWPDDQRVSIQKQNGSYTEFPNDIRLRDFDSDDRKFVAVCAAHPDSPPIFEATDREWWKYRKILADVGIPVEFVCQDYMKTET